MVDFADLSADVCGVMFGGASVGAGTALVGGALEGPLPSAYRRDDDMDAPLLTLDSKRPRTSSTMGDLGQQIVRFVGFRQEGQDVGAIEMTERGVKMSSEAGDFAEWHPQLNPLEDLEEGDVVGMHKGRVSRQVEGAAMVAIVTHKAVVVGSVPSAANGQREPGVEVAYCGRVPVRAEGTIRDGDVLYSSGRGDGLAVPSKEPRVDIACDCKPGETGKKPARRMVGVAIGTSGTGDETGVRLVDVVVTPPSLSAAELRQARGRSVCPLRFVKTAAMVMIVIGALFCAALALRTTASDQDCPAVTPVDGLKIEYSNGLHSGSTADFNCWQNVPDNPTGLMGRIQCRDGAWEAVHLDLGGIHLTSRVAQGPPTECLPLQLYAIGGYGTELASVGPGGRPLSSAEIQRDRFSLEVQWNPIAPLKDSRAHHAAASVGSFIYVFGGSEQTDWLDSKLLTTNVEAFDTQRNSWSTVSAMKTKRWNPSAVAVFDPTKTMAPMIIVMGGKSPIMVENKQWMLAVDSVEAYHPDAPALRQWSTLAPMRSRRASFASAVWHGKVYVCGGQTALTQGSEVDEASSTRQVRAPCPPRALDVRRADTSQTPVFPLLTWDCFDAYPVRTPCRLEHLRSSRPLTIAARRAGLERPEAYHRRCGSVRCRQQHVVRHPQHENGQAPLRGRRVAGQDLCLRRNDREVGREMDPGRAVPFDGGGLRHRIRHLERDVADAVQPRDAFHGGHRQPPRRHGWPGGT